MGASPDVPASALPAETSSNTLVTPGDLAFQPAMLDNATGLANAHSSSPYTNLALALERTGDTGAANPADLANNPTLLTQSQEAPTPFQQSGQSTPLQQTVATDELATSSLPNNSTSVPEINTPYSLEEAQNLGEEANAVTSPYDLRKGYGVNPEDITDADRREAQLTSSTPEYVAGQRIVNQRTVSAESAGQDVSRSSG